MYKKELHIILLCSYMVKMLLFSPNMADAVILVSLAALYSYRLFLTHQEHSNREKELDKTQKEMISKIEELNKLISKHDSSLANLESSLGKMSMTVARGQSNSPKKIERGSVIF